MLHAELTKWGHTSYIYAVAGVRAKSYGRTQQAVA